MDPIWSVWVVLGWVFLTHNGGLGWKNPLTQPTQPDSYKSLFKSINLQKRYIEILM